MPLCLGKKPAAPSDTDFLFKAVRRRITMPTPPRRFGHGYAYQDWLMLGNGPDPTVRPGFGGAGCCVLSDAGHATMLTNRLARKKVTITGKETIADYSAVTGYVLGDDSTDNGTEMRDAFAYRRSTGILDANGDRHKIGAYVSIIPQDWDELRLATYVFTAVSIGFEFPTTAWAQFDAGEPWDPVDMDGSTIEGGHDVPVVGFATTDRCGVISWGKRQGMTRRFYQEYNDETWCTIFEEELRRGKTYRGFSLENLQAMLAQLG